MCSCWRNAIGQCQLRSHLVYYSSYILLTCLVIFWSPVFQKFAWFLALFFYLFNSPTTRDYERYYLHYREVWLGTYIRIMFDPLTMFFNSLDLVYLLSIYYSIFELYIRHSTQLSDTVSAYTSVYLSLYAHHTHTSVYTGAGSGFLLVIYRMTSGWPRPLLLAQYGGGRGLRVLVRRDVWSDCSMCRPR